MNSTRELHYRYAVSYLLAAIVLLLALRYYDVPNLVDKLSFALTVTSLVLAILAIFYSVVSAQKQDLQFANLVETNAHLENAAADMGAAAAEIRTFARDAPQHFNALRMRLDDITVNYGTLKSETVQPAKTDDSSPGPPNVEAPHFLRMFAQLQFSAMAVVYLFERSFAKSITIEPETLDKLGFASFEYAVGLLNGLETTGLIEMRIHKGAIVPVKCMKVVTSNISGALERVLSVVNSANAGRLRSFVQAVDEHVAKSR